jgi:hypothetical protein
MPVPNSNDLVTVVRMSRHAADVLRRVSRVARLNERTLLRCWKTFVNGRQGLIVEATMPGNGQKKRNDEQTRRNVEWKQMQHAARQKQRRKLVETKDVMLHEVVVIQVVVVLLIPAVAVKRSWKRFAHGCPKVVVAKDEMLPEDGVVPAARIS